MNKGSKSLKKTEKKQQKASNTSTVTATPPIRDIHLKHPEDCRRLLSSTINQLRQGKITESTAKTLAYLIQTMLSCLEQIDLERRLAALESKAQQQR
ncbi:MAG: hypothetical protein A4E66_00484 [Syntrophus sp. PtaB.Bin001]|nr:MAG: hypothetical protein A4E66_00484 [Syntrophus sp. PtaB.Bin001]